MRKDIQDQWVAALRSGVYLQGRNFLNQNNELFCCLGVLSDMCAKENPLSLHVEVSSDGMVFYDHQNDLPPRSIQEWAGLDDEYGTLRSVKDREGGRMYLSGLNDEGFTFTQIADLIEHFGHEL